MVNSISYNASARGAYALMQQMGGDSNELFSSLAGTNGGGAESALFGALAGNGGTTKSVDFILQEQKISNSKNQIYNNAALRLTGIQEGTYTPTEEWEQVAGYAMAKGRPVIVSIDSSTGAVQANLQAEDSLSNFNSELQERILQLNDDASLMAQKIQANTTNESWLKKLEGASYDLYLVFNNAAPAQTTTSNNWEQQGLLYMQTNRPFKISLDAKGDLQVLDQAADPELQKLSITQQRVLGAAIQSIPMTISEGTALKDWELEANNFAKSGVPYYLEMDPITSIITAKENSPENITPAFLKTPPYPDVGDDTPALQQAAEFIRSGKAYFFDVDISGQIGAKEATAQNLLKYNTPAANQFSSLGTGSILSLFA
ncbi:MAG: hypothetical protein Q7R40_06875 [Phaeospirillum sp.]|nr:hypothetical protein [Phaeospirillum sp.]